MVDSSERTQAKIVEISDISGQYYQYFASSLFSDSNLDDRLLMGRSRLYLVAGLKCASDKDFLGRRFFQAIRVP